MRGSEPSPAFGSTTNRFFAEGEEHEANDWQDTILPPDDEPESHVQSGSFDKVPRQKGVIVALALFGICFAAAVGFGVGSLVRGGLSVEASTIDFATGEGLQTAEAPVPPPPAAPTGLVSEQAAASAELTVQSGPAAPANPAASPDDGANAGLENSPAAAAPALPETSAAAAVPTDRKPRVEEVREPSRGAEAKPARRMRSALRAARQRTMTTALVKPLPSESLAKSGTPEPWLDSSLEKASDPFANDALVPPRLVEPSIAPPMTGAIAPEKVQPSAEELRLPASDKAADPTPTSGNAADPFQPAEAK